MPRRRRDKRGRAKKKVIKRTIRMTATTHASTTPMNRKCSIPSGGMCGGNNVGHHNHESCCDKGHVLISVGAVINGPSPKNCPLLDYSGAEFRYVTQTQMERGPPIIKKMAQEAVGLCLRRSIRPRDPQHLRLAALCNSQRALHFMVMWDQKIAEECKQYEGGDLCLLGWDGRHIELSTCSTTGEEVELPRIILRRGDVIKLSREGRLDFERPLIKQNIIIPWLLKRKEKPAPDQEQEEEPEEALLDDDALSSDGITSNDEEDDESPMVQMRVVKHRVEPDQGTLQEHKEDEEPVYKEVLEISVSDCKIICN